MDELLQRRQLLLRSIKVAVAAVAGPLVLERARAAEACVEPSSESLRGSLHYVDPSPRAAEECSQCGFFTADKAPCGPCAIMTGPVSAKAHCDSWAAKAAVSVPTRSSRVS